MEWVRIGTMRQLWRCSINGSSEDVSRMLKIRLKGEKQRGKLEVGERVDALCARLDSS